MNKISSILLFISLVWMLTGCSDPTPLGGLVDKEKSDLYYYGWNKKQVYYRHNYEMKGIRWVKYEQLEDVDGPSFVVLKKHLAMDNRFVFYTTIKQEQLDRSSFYLNPHGLECDKNGVYTFHYNSGSVKNRNYFRLVEGADPRSFHHLDAKIYGRAGRHKFAQDDYSIFKATPEAYLKTDMHGPSFRILNRHFAADKDSVYLFLKNKIAAAPLAEGKLEPMGPFLWNNNVIYAVAESAGKWQAIPVKDPGSVALEFDVKDYESRSKGIVPYLWVDQTLYLWNEVFHHGKLDMATLTSYPDAGYYKDKDRVYYRKKVDEKVEGRLPGKLLPAADPATFEYVGSSVFRDKHNIYTQGVALAGVDSKTFTKVKGVNGVFKDKDRVYVSSSGKLVVIKDADSSTFEEVGTFFGVFRDKNRVYYYSAGEIVQKQMADAATFVPLQSRPAVYQDKEYFYFYNKKYLACIRGRMDTGSIHAYPGLNYVADNYGVFIGGADGEREPHPFGEINSKEVLEKVRKFAKEKEKLSGK